ncbi:MAG: hypothetical protein HY508_10850 [Acidobacteria bacterium]|nr:hypothetical protein [Acidobacteriota bacterium]
MPGKRYNFRITAGPLKGHRARVIVWFLGENKAQVTLDTRQITEMPADWMKEIPNKAPRRKKGGKKR